MKNILCPYDFSQKAEKALLYANDLAMRTGGKVILYYAYHFPVYVHADDIMSTDQDSHEDEIKDNLEGLCRDLAKENFGKEVDYEFVVKKGLFLDTISSVVKEKRIDMIVMGTDGASGLKDLLGSTFSESVAQKVVCPVLIIPGSTAFKRVSRIVYASELNGGEEQILKYIIHFASLYSSYIDVVHIADEYNPEVEDIAKSFIESLALKLNYDKLKFHLVAGDEVFAGLITFSKEEFANLLVVAPNQKSFFDRLFAKSHTKELARHSDIPLLVVKK
ncbi:MAG: universal stress protein [Cytophagaceae bacterium]